VLEEYLRAAEYDDGGRDEGEARPTDGPTEQIE
jgi:hypothetical protein